MTHSLLSSHRRITVKIGSALLVDRGTGLRGQWLTSLCQDIAGLRAQGCEVLVVSSGAIALGRTLLKLNDTVLKLEESQAAAATGQIALAHAWSGELARHNLSAGQILLTLGDTEERRRYLNARSTISTLLKLGGIPIINENDTVATSEIRYGDNDRLAARVATMAGADLLILLSDIDGLYDAPPHLNNKAQLIREVETITPQIEAMAGGAASHLSRGGMVTKIDAAKIATRAGTAMIIASGKRLHPLQAIDEGTPHTYFRGALQPVSAYKSWIAGHLEPAGYLTIDQGACRALLAGKSLLAAGVIGVDGDFTRGDTVAVRDERDFEVARGLVAYDASDAVQIMGRKSGEIIDVLGYQPRAAMIHRDDLALTALVQSNG